MGTYPFAPALKLWLENQGVKPVIWDGEGKAYYLLGRCVECARNGKERYLYEDAGHEESCFSIEQIDLMS